MKEDDTEQNLIVAEQTTKRGGHINWEGRRTCAQAGENCEEEVGE